LIPALELFNQEFRDLKLTKDEQLAELELQQDELKKRDHQAKIKKASLHQAKKEVDMYALLFSENLGFDISRLNNLKSENYGFTVKCATNGPNGIPTAEDKQEWLNKYKSHLNGLLLIEKEELEHLKRNRGDTGQREVDEFVRLSVSSNNCSLIFITLVGSIEEKGRWP